MTKVTTCISLDSELRRKAKAMGINISQLTEEAIRRSLDKGDPHTIAIDLSHQRKELTEQRAATEQELQGIEKRALHLFDGQTLDQYLEKHDLVESARRAQAVAAMMARIKEDPTRGEWRIEQWLSTYDTILEGYGIPRHEHRIMVDRALAMYWKEAHAPHIYG